MNPLPFHILLALTAGDGPAGQIYHRAEVESGSLLLIRERSFYTALQRLVVTGLVAVDNSPSRPLYRLTQLGRRQLQAEKIRLGEAVRLLHERF